MTITRALLRRHIWLRSRNGAAASSTVGCILVVVVVSLDFDWNEGLIIEDDVVADDDGDNDEEDDDGDDDIVGDGDNDIVGDVALLKAE